MRHRVRASNNLHAQLRQAIDVAFDHLALDDWADVFRGAGINDVAGEQNGGFRVGSEPISIACAA